MALRGYDYQRIWTFMFGQVDVIMLPNVHFMVFNTVHLCVKDSSETANIKCRGWGSSPALTRALSATFKGCSQKRTAALVCAFPLGPGEDSLRWAWEIPCCSRTIWEPSQSLVVTANAEAEKKIFPSVCTNLLFLLQLGREEGTESKVAVGGIKGRRVRLMLILPDHFLVRAGNAKLLGVGAGNIIIWTVIIEGIKEESPSAKLPEEQRYLEGKTANSPSPATGKRKPHLVRTRAPFPVPVKSTHLPQAPCARQTQAPAPSTYLFADLLCLCA